MDCTGPKWDPMGPAGDPLFSSLSSFACSATPAWSTAFTDVAPKANKPLFPLVAARQPHHRRQRDHGRDREHDDHGGQQWLPLRNRRRGPLAEEPCESLEGFF